MSAEVKLSLEEYLRLYESDKQRVILQAAIDKYATILYKKETSMICQGKIYYYVSEDEIIRETKKVIELVQLEKQTTIEIANNKIDYLNREIERLLNLYVRPAPTSKPKWYEKLKFWN